MRLACLRRRFHGSLSDGSRQFETPRHLVFNQHGRVQFTLTRYAERIRIFGFFMRSARLPPALWCSNGEIGEVPTCFFVPEQRGVNAKNAIPVSSSTDGITGLHSCGCRNGVGEIFGSPRPVNHRRDIAASAISLSFPLQTVGKRTAAPLRFSLLLIG